MNSLTACATPRAAPAAVKLPRPADHRRLLRAGVVARPCTPAARLRRRPAPAASQSGVGLIEVLVAVLVLSIGFLGMAALQAMSLSTNNSAMARSMATIASYSIQDAMRADIVNAKSGAYNTTVTANACPAAAAGASLATAQLSQWCAQLSQALGPVSSTTGMIACSGTGNCTITITFDDSRAGLAGSNTQKVITQGML
jgi:type IV pilus assembly protein PilV